MFQKVFVWKGLAIHQYRVLLSSRYHDLVPFQCMESPSTDMKNETEEVYTGNFTDHRET